MATEGDLQTFSLEDIGLTARFVKEDFLQGSLAYGVEWHQEKLVSGGYKFDANGNRTTDLAQGPLAADAIYDRLATYFQYQHEFDSGWSVEPGIRYSATKADLRKFYEKNSDASTLFAPEEKAYEEIIGSLRATRQINEELLFLAVCHKASDHPAYMTSPLPMKQVPWNAPIPNLNRKNFCKLN